MHPLVGFFEGDASMAEAERKLEETNERLRRLTSELAAAEERERRKIAVDFNRNIGQTLAVTKMRLDALQGIAEQSGFGDQLREIRQMVEKSILQAQSLMTELSPSVLYELGFTQAIEWLAEQVQARHGLQIRLKVNAPIGRIDRDIELLLFRALRELLMNICGRAHAKKVFLSMQERGKYILITVHDDRAGFHPSRDGTTSGKEGGSDLFGIRERLTALGGSLEMKTQPEGGATITLAAPRHAGKKRTGVT
jgi:signal transduction histidine kinase